MIDGATAKFYMTDGKVFYGGKGKFYRQARTWTGTNNIMRSLVYQANLHHDYDDAPKMWRFTKPDLEKVQIVWEEEETYREFHWLSERKSAKRKKVWYWYTFAGLYPEFRIYDRLNRDITEEIKDHKTDIVSWTRPREDYYFVDLGAS